MTEKQRILSVAPKITRHTALLVIDAALSRGESLSKPLCVTVVDAGGHEIALVRADDCKWLATGVARAKAASAAATQLATSELAVLDSQVPGLLEQWQSQTHFPIAIVPGGIPVFHDGILIGAVGVSGASPADDEAIALSTQQQFALLS